MIRYLLFIIPVFPEQCECGIEGGQKNRIIGGTEVRVNYCNGYAVHHALPTELIDLYIYIYGPI